MKRQFMDNLIGTKTKIYKMFQLFYFIINCMSHCLLLKRNIHRIAYKKIFRYQFFIKFEF